MAGLLQMVAKEKKLQDGVVEQAKKDGHLYKAEKFQEMEID